MSFCVFGKDIARSFTADDGSQYLELPTQTPTIYVFDYAPSYDQAIAGTNAIRTVSTWELGANGKEHTYLIPAIDDTDPQGAVLAKEYWECIKYVLQSSEQVQTKIRMFEISRAEALESIPNLSAEDISSIWAGVSSYISKSQLSAFLPIAEQEMRNEIGQVKWSRLSKLSNAKLCLAYKAIEMMAAGQVVKGNADKFIWMVEYFGKKYLEASSKLILPLDADRDGRPEEIVEVSRGVIFSNR